MNFSKFKSENPEIKFGCGIRKRPSETFFYQKGGMMVSISPEEIRNPDDVDGIRKLVVDFVDTAMVVKDRYNPEYHFLP